jgi:hypothetical protein
LLRNILFWSVLRTSPRLFTREMFETFSHKSGGERSEPNKKAP